MGNRDGTGVEKKLAMDKGWLRDWNRDENELDSFSLVYLEGFSVSEEDGRSDSRSFTALCKFLRFEDIHFSIISSSL